MSIKNLAEDDRPREKFLLKGKNSLSDAELLAIIMGSGNREESAVDLARRILESVNYNWHQLSLLSVKDLMKFKGVGEAKAISIATDLEIGKRKNAQEIPEKKIITSSNDAYQVLKYDLEDLQTEEFWVVFLNQSNKVIYKTCLTRGGITQTTIDIRVLFKLAFEHMATAIIVAHNHPSGSLKPSAEDMKITENIRKAGELLNIKLFDHLIITHQNYYSFSDSDVL